KPVGTRPARPSNVTYVAYERLVPGPGGQLCATTGYRAVDRGVHPAIATVPDRYIGNVLATYQPCPSRATNQRAAQPEAIVAERFWQEVPLPAPRPRIAPGWAITGKQSFLETNGTTTHTFTRNTSFGPMEVTATGDYSVDWGDGTVTGPHRGEGGPWPGGRITHTYQRVGHYDVVVTERWTATWRVGARTGRLSELRTAGRIDGFRVEQVQAVIVG
ncbi:MAG: hypothetical protein ACRD0Q_08910, partial [Acidimicrobiales bacterium]